MKQRGLVNPSWQVHFPLHFRTIATSDITPTVKPTQSDADDGFAGVIVPISSGATNSV